MWELDHKEGRVLKNWYFWTVVLKKPLESPLDCKEIQLVYPKGNQFWIFIRRTNAEAEAPILWHLIWRANSLGKRLMLGKRKGRRRKGRQRIRWLDDVMDPMDMSLSQLREMAKDREAWCVCSPWGCKELDRTETEQQPKITFLLTIWMFYCSLSLSPSPLCVFNLYFFENFSVLLKNHHLSGINTIKLRLLNFSIKCIILL